MLKRDKTKIMLSYYISQSNEFVVRTEDSASSQGDSGSYELTLELYNLYTHATSSYDLSGSFTFNPYENILTYSQSLEGNTSTGDEYLTKVISTSGSNQLEIWRGSMQVYASQSIDKTIYKTQNDGYVSNQTDNDYIVL
jgi:hypothetical protein